MEDTACKKLPGLVSAIASHKIVVMFVCLFQSFDPVKFHDRHGAWIVLSNDNKTAQRTRGCNNGVVIVSTPLAVGELYEVMFIHSSLLKYVFSYTFNWGQVHRGTGDHRFFWWFLLCKDQCCDRVETWQNVSFRSLLFSKSPVPNKKYRQQKIFTYDVM
jgi:hypothetical protein